MPLSWTEAEHICRARGLVLFEPHSDAMEKVFFSMLIKESNFGILIPISIGQQKVYLTYL